MFMSDIGLQFFFNGIVWFYYHMMFQEKVSPLLFSGKVYVDLTLFLQ